MSYLFLAASILFEVFSSTMLKLSDGFKRLLPVIGIVLGYGISFYALSITLQSLPLGVVYATWSGVGTILTVVIGILLFKERVNKKGVLGIAILLVGLVLMNLSK
ncbi:QacE family quaternary ammonium compound efflux SMR transporter [Terribacillus saccharophilus]|nr:QacE family quaternary ammonium compound efflux SMR transporter [Terribacillus saccharophilus]PAF22996.1 QacE family quaternary ammonium compound efflux SMR transporter [Terribacillus saccharophilus]PAF36683.1 QacE family quaternary ammonium compound efflux SMR transporter [Terribacillus saccharophilus]PAF40407.1 QacE family quaternary ammonium compound efflux SMR transporter [Terribacillus saccharophilus]